MWTSFIVLSVVITQIHGQGFQLFFGTTPGRTGTFDFDTHSPAGKSLEIVDLIKCLS